MGNLSNLLRGQTKANDYAQRQVAAGQSMWRQAFGQAKEDPPKAQFPNVRNANSWTRGVVSEPAAFKRLLQAVRSMAPGGWSDDRWEQAQHLTGIVYTAIHRKCEQLSMSTFQVYKKDHRLPDGKRPITRKDPPEGGRPCRPYDLVELLENPNNDDSFGDIIYWVAQQMDLTGMGLQWMVPNALGIPHELYVIPTSTAIPQPAINPDYPDGYYRIQPVYPYGPFSSYPTPATAVGAPIPAQWMLRFKYPHPILRYDGYSPLTAMELQVDEVDAMDRSRWYSCNSILNPSAILNMKDVTGMEPLPDSEIERIRADIQNSFQGPENSGKLWIAAPGSELKLVENRLRDMEFRDGWEQLVSFVHGAGFGVSRPAAGMVETSSYSVLFATLKQMHLLTLKPQCDRFGRYYTKHLAPFFGDDLIVEIKAPRIDDHDVANAIVNLLMAGKALTKNEMRTKLSALGNISFPPVEESWGDEIAGTESQQPPAPGMGAEMPGQGAPAGMGAMPGMPAGMPPALNTGPQAPMVGEQDLTKKEPPEVFNNRPQPGKFGQGAKGPNKGLNNTHTKSFEDALDEELNGEATLPAKIRNRMLDDVLGKELTNGYH